MGKPCGHNEVVMHAVRPFAPLEVLNTRCCSRKAPAPGNKGFDGCLEFLACRCRAKKTPTTVWDSNAFIHALLPVRWMLPKQELLSRSVESLAAGPKIAGATAYARFGAAARIIGETESERYVCLLAQRDYAKTRCRRRPPGRSRRAGSRTRYAEKTTKSRRNQTSCDACAASAA